MALALNEKQIAHFRDAGYVSPIEMFSLDEVAEYRALLEDYERKHGGPVSGATRSKCHLLFKWVDDMMRDHRIVDLVEDLIGGNILCWNALFWVKEAGSKSFVSWHQDARYWGLTTKQLVTVWVALSPASVASGCMRVLPGSHRGELLAHRDEYHEDNMLTRGQRVAASVDEALAVPMPLDPGQVSLHNVCLAHASGPNTTNERRIGLSFHYMPTDSRQTVVPWDSAALIRGRDEFQHFTHTPRPTEDFELSAVEFHRKASDVVREVVFKDAASTRSTL
jgi:non-heme Fe2+,alpha-ketoglutarate-dependent halogenase